MIANQRNTPSGMSRARHLSGFTMVEMMIVIAIIMLAAALMIPSIHRYLNNRRIDVAGRSIVSVLNEARAEAITKRKAHHIVFLKDSMYMYSDATQRFDATRRRIVLHPSVRFELKFAEEEVRGFGGLRGRLVDENGDEPATADYDPESMEFNRAQEIYLTFTSTGTVEFGRFDDIPGENYSSGTNADILIIQKNNQNMGFIDVRPAGMVAFKVEPPKQTMQ